MYLGDGGTERLNSHTIDAQQGDLFYLLSDGYADQKGGVENTKFYSKRVEEMLLENYTESLAKQGEIFEKIFNDWKGDNRQVDDVTILGFKV